MFEGFQRGTLEFLTELEAHNYKEWFDTHRDDYEANFVAPARAFVEEVGPAVLALAPKVSVDPRINGSIFRINRDARFAGTKNPYKPHIDIWFWEGERKTAVSGFFLRLTPKRMILGAGAHRFDKVRLAAWRDLTANRDAREELIGVIEELRIAGLPLRGKSLRRLPRGYTASDKLHETLLLHTAVWADRDTLLPPWVGTPEFAEQCLDLWTKAAPLHRWLTAWMG